jgi:MarC family membrane protein
MNLFTLAFSLFLLMDSIGNIPIFLSILKEIPAKRQRWIIFRELCIAFGIMVIFLYLGNFILGHLGIETGTVMISGGIILFLIAIRMIFPVKEVIEKDKSYEEPLIVPLAIPLVAGPGVLATIMIYSRQGQQLFLLAAIAIAWFITTLVLVSSSFLKKVLGNRGMIACERLMGLILTMIAIQMFLSGIDAFCKAHSL